MALPATDDFNRANANPIGGNWTTVTGNSALKILNEKVYGSVIGGCSAFWNADAFGDDQYSIATLVAALINHPTGVTVRTSAVANTWYLWRHESASVCRFYKMVAGTATQLGSDIASTFVQNDVLKCEVVGTTITGYKNGASLGSRTDSAIASGSAGIRTNGDSTPVDDWEGGNVAAGGLSIPVAMHHYLHSMGR